MFIQAGLYSIISYFEMKKFREGKSLTLTPGGLVAKCLRDGIKYHVKDKEGRLHERVILSGNRATYFQASFIKWCVNLLFAVGIVLLFKHTKLSEIYLLDSIFVDTFAWPMVGVCIMPILFYGICFGFKRLRPDTVENLKQTALGKILPF